MSELHIEWHGWLGLQNERPRGSGTGIRLFQYLSDPKATAQPPRMLVLTKLTTHADLFWFWLGPWGLCNAGQDTPRGLTLVATGPQTGGPVLHRCTGFSCRVSFGFLGIHSSVLLPACLPYLQGRSLHCTSSACMSHVMISCIICRFRL